MFSPQPNHIHLIEHHNKTLSGWLFSDSFPDHTKKNGFRMKFRLYLSSVVIGMGQSGSVLILEKSIKCQSLMIQTEVTARSVRYTVANFYLPLNLTKAL